MQREINFRAWLEDEKKMIDVELVDFKKRIIFTYTDFWYGGDDCLIEGSGNTLTFEEIELIQYAGCINGIDVYEGYIIQGWFDTGFYAKGKVIFNDKRAAFMVSMWDRPNVMFYLDEIKKLSVLGNVYENPELLEVK